VITLAAALLLQVKVPVPARVGDTTDVPQVTLAEALKRAVGVDPDYIRTAGQIDVAEWGRRAAMLAFIVPSLNVSVDATKFSDPFFNIGIGQPTANAVNFRATGVYELFSVRKFADVALRKAELQAAAATSEQQRLQLAFDVENDFYDVLANQALLRVAENRSQRAEEQKQVARARVLSGAAVQTDSLQLEVETTQAQIDLLRRQAAARVSRLQLGRRIGEAREIGAVAPDSLVPPPLEYDDATLVRMALEQGPQYRAARANERAADAALSGQKSTYFPTVNLSGGYTIFDDKFWPSGRSIGSLTLTVSYPIWNLGQRELAVAQARVDRDVSRALRADLERAAWRDVVEAATAYRIAYEAVALTNRQLDAARETFRVQNLRYRSGANTILDLLEAQFQLTNAEAQVVQALYALNLSRAGLEAVVGRQLFSGRIGE
jgi:multidrug efflux pump/multidrug efflux system outer membrane protein